MPTIERPDPPYQQVVRQIRDQITRGELVEGDTIPSARQIANDYGLALATAAKVLSTLRAEGLVLGVPGRGTVVQGPSHRSARDRSTSVLHTGRIYPAGHYAKILSADLVEAPALIADALGLEAGSAVIRRRRTTYDSSDRPLSTSVSWFDGALATEAPLLLERARIKQGTFAYVEQCTGRTRSAREKLILSAAAATADEADQLQIDSEAPVLRGRNFFWDTEDIVIEYGESAARHDLETIIEFNSEAT